MLPQARKISTKGGENLKFLTFIVNSWLLQCFLIVTTHTRPSVFNRLKASLVQAPERRWCNEKQEFSKVEYFKVSANMITLVRKKKTKRVSHPNYSDSEHSSSLKGVFEESQGVFQIPSTRPIWKEYLRNLKVFSEILVSIRGLQYLWIIESWLESFLMTKKIQT